MFKNIEYSLRKFLLEQGIKIGISQPIKEDFVSVIAVDSYEKDVKSFDDDYKVDKINFLLHIVASNHAKMIELLDKYLAIKEGGEIPFQVYDFSSGTAVSDIECTLSMPESIQFNAPYGTTFMDTIVITYRRL